MKSKYNMTTILLLFFWISQSYLTVTITNIFWKFCIFPESVSNEIARDFFGYLTLFSLLTFLFIRSLPLHFFNT